MAYKTDVIGHGSDAHYRPHRTNDNPIVYTPAANPRQYHNDLQGVQGVHCITALNIYSRDYNLKSHYGFLFKEQRLANSNLVVITRNLYVNSQLLIIIIIIIVLVIIRM